MGSINPGIIRQRDAEAYPGVGEDYARTFKAQKDMQIDVWLASHASQFKLHEKYKPGDAYNPDRFVDPQGFKASVESLEKKYEDQLARERARKQVGRGRQRREQQFDDLKNSFQREPSSRGRTIGPRATQGF